MSKLAQARIIAHEKDAAELAKAKKEIKDLKANISKMSAEADAKMAEMKKTLITGTKRDATIAIFESRLRMASEAFAKGFDTSLWPVDTWKAKLAIAKGEDPEMVAASASKVPKAVDTSPAALKSQEDIDTGTLATVTEVLQGLATAGDGDILGEEGN